MTFRRLVFMAVIAIMLAACGGKTPTAAPADAPGVGTQPNPPAPTQQPPTPLPTVPPETLTTDQVTQRLDPFASADCQLPCYNGLTPGDTGLYDALGFYSRLGIALADFVPGDLQHVINGMGNLRATLNRTTDIKQALDAGFIPPETNVYLTDSKVQMIYVRYQTYPQSLAAARVITSLGPPDKVGLALLFTTDPNTPTNFVIQMAYNARQAGFSYLGSTVGDAAAQQVCLTDTGVRETVMGVFAAGFIPFSDNPPTPKILPLDESTGISAADFATAIAASGCIRIPSDQWLQWRP